MGVAQVFVGKIFLHRLQTTKSTKILPLENYGTLRQASVCSMIHCSLPTGGGVSVLLLVLSVHHLPDSCHSSESVRAGLPPPRPGLPLPGARYAQRQTEKQTQEVSTHTHTHLTTAYAILHAVGRSCVW